MILACNFSRHQPCSNAAIVANTTGGNAIGAKTVYELTRPTSDRARPQSRIRIAAKSDRPPTAARETKSAYARSDRTSKVASRCAFPHTKPQTMTWSRPPTLALVRQSTALSRKHEEASVRFETAVRCKRQIRNQLDSQLDRCSLRNNPRTPPNAPGVPRPGTSSTAHRLARPDGLLKT